MTFGPTVRRACRLKGAGPHAAWRRPTLRLWKLCSKAETRFVLPSTIHRRTSFLYLSPAFFSFLLLSLTKSALFFFLSLHSLVKCEDYLRNCRPAQKTQVLKLIAMHRNICNDIHATFPFRLYFYNVKVTFISHFFLLWEFFFDVFERETSFIEVKKIVFVIILIYQTC